MKSTSLGGLLNGRLQMLHIHVLLAAPLGGTSHIAQPSTDQHNFNAFLHLLSCSFQITTALAFSRAAFLLSWAWIALSILTASFTLERGVTENTFCETYSTFSLCFMVLLFYRRFFEIMNVSISDIAKRRLGIKSKTAFSVVVSERTFHSETAAEKISVRPIPIWWRRRESNPRPKTLPHDLLRV